MFVVVGVFFLFIMNIMVFINLVILDVNEFCIWFVFLYSFIK